MNSKHVSEVATMINVIYNSTKNLRADWDYISKKFEDNVHPMLKTWMSTIINSSKVIYDGVESESYTREDACRAYERAYSWYSYFGDDTLKLYYYEKDTKRIDEENKLTGNIYEHMISSKIMIDYINDKLKSCIEELGYTDNFNRIKVNFYKYYNFITRNILLFEFSDIEEEEKLIGKKSIFTPVATTQKPYISGERNTGKRELDNALKDALITHAVSKKEVIEKDMTVDGKCSHCGGCCSVTTGISIDDYRRLKRIIKEKHVEKYLHMIENNYFKDECPFRYENRCDIYTGKPEICSIYICNREKLEETTKRIVTRKSFKRRSKLIFDIIPNEIKDKLLESDIIRQFIDDARSKL